MEDDEIKCPHNGVVKLKSGKGKTLQSCGVPLILESDLLNAPIVGCTNNISGIPTPCTQVSVILPSARALKKHNDDYPIMQDLVSSGVFSDKGFPLTCTPKPNRFKMSSPSPTQGDATPAQEDLSEHILLAKPSLRLHYKVNIFQIDNLSVRKIKLNGEIVEISPPSLLIDLDKEAKPVQDESLHSLLAARYSKNYAIKQLDLQLDSTALRLIVLLPLKMPHSYKKAYENYEHKEYGIGRYVYCYDFCGHKDMEMLDYTKVGLDQEPDNQYTLAFIAPYGASKLQLDFAYGLDSVLREQDSTKKENAQDEANVLEIVVVNGGHTERWWGSEG